MNYEFHVGDYVETTGGEKGFIKNIEPAEDDRYQIVIVQMNNGTYSFAIPFEEFYGYDGIYTVFTRIGAYDFTKKETKKIEALIKPQWDIPVEDLINKINELIDAVNLLLDKSTES